MRMQDQDTMRILIDALQNGEIGLNDSMQAVLARAPAPNDWAAFQNRLDLIDLVWLAAKSADSFALLRSDGYDILLHGQKEDCRLSGVLLEMLYSNKLQVVAICRPGKIEPELM